MRTIFILPTVFES